MDVSMLGVTRTREGKVFLLPTNYLCPSHVD
jgi:hypothetical protein